MPRPLLSALLLLAALVLLPAALSAQTPEETIAQWRTCVADAYRATRIEGSTSRMVRTYPPGLRACLTGLNAKVYVQTAFSGLEGIVPADTLLGDLRAGLHRQGYELVLLEPGSVLREDEPRFEVVLDPASADSMIMVRIAGTGGASGSGLFFSTPEQVRREVVEKAQRLFDAYAAARGWVLPTTILLQHERQHPPEQAALPSSVEPAMQARYETWQAEAEALARRTACELRFFGDQLHYELKGGFPSTPNAVLLPVRLSAESDQTLQQQVVELLNTLAPADLYVDEWKGQPTPLSPLDIHIEQRLVERKRPGLKSIMQPQVEVKSGGTSYFTEGELTSLVLRDALDRVLDDYLTRYAPVRFGELLLRAQWEECLYRSGADLR